MKKRLVLLLMAILILTGCGNTAVPAGSEETTNPAQTNVNKKESANTAGKTESQEEDLIFSETEQKESGTVSDTLVIYFSRTGEQYTVGVIDKGNTAIVAEMIADKTGADLFEVLPADDHYPMTYKELTDVAKQEQNENARPAFAGELPDMSHYDTVFIGAPVWWGDWPMIMYTVFENSDFSGKTLIPFSTHEGSGLSGFDKKLKKSCPGASIEKGLAVRGNDTQNDQETVMHTVNSWLSELGF